MDSDNIGMRISDESLGAHTKLLRRLQTPLLAMLVVALCFYFQPKSYRFDAAATRRGNASHARHSNDQTHRKDHTTVTTSLNGDPESAESQPTSNVAGPGPIPSRLDHVAAFARLMATVDQIFESHFGHDCVARAIAKVAIAATRSAALPAGQQTVTDGLILRNPASTGGPIAFLLNDAVHRLEPGDEVVVTDSGPKTVHFHRGGSLGESKQILTSGIYEFRITAKGWDLVPANGDRNQ
jgi:hypothetical protein